MGVDPMSEPWTPGPWRIEGPTEYRTWYIYGAAHYGTTVVCETGEADARLIAAAPEMAALVDRLAVIRPTYESDAVVLRDEARALLRRIRGDA